jgi:hypothetical protein
MGGGDVVEDDFCHDFWKVGGWLCVPFVFNLFNLIECFSGWCGVLSCNGVKLLSPDFDPDVSFEGFQWSSGGPKVRLRENKCNGDRKSEMVLIDAGYFRLVG